MLADVQTKRSRFSGRRDARPVDNGDALVETAKGADMLELARRYTTLRRESSHEWAGPCPRCGGDDRFHCTTQWWFCRICHPKQSDSIDLVRWLTGASFRESVAMITGVSMPTMSITELRSRYAGAVTVPVKPAKVTQTPPDAQARLLTQWQSEAEAETAAAEILLASEDGAAGRAYLEGRGLEPHVWQAFRLGYVPDVPLPGTGGTQRRPAILMPWTVGGQVAAIRYRFLEKHTYTDRDGREREGIKQTAKAKAFGEQPMFSGRMFGGLGLAGPVGGKFDLVICEGEINALSIWQVAHEGRVDVLSLGSESQHITDAMLKAICEYRRVIVWMDKAEKLAELRARIPGATGIASPHSMDANDCLQKSTLQPMIADLRLRACKDDAEREALLWDLWDQHNLYGGVDEPTQAIIAELRGRLGK